MRSSAAARAAAAVVLVAGIRRLLSQSAAAAAAAARRTHGRWLVPQCAQQIRSRRLSHSAHMAAVDAASLLIQTAPRTVAPPLVLLTDAITAEEEASLVEQLAPPLRRRNYLCAHFDGVIEQYRELERPLPWFSPSNQHTLARVIRLAFGTATPALLPAHVLELAPGAASFIRPHVDHVGASGRTIAGLSLLSDSVMQLTHVDAPERSVRLFLRRRSLYVLEGEARYEWKHEILPDLLGFPVELRTEADAADESERGAHDKGRRIAVVIRDEPRAVDSVAGAVLPGGMAPLRYGAIQAEGEPPDLSVFPTER
ncbi:hypothetical protein T492DRAFT_1092096 [Pavlovales sp. CCMP2436]|nr:hypothetical protein T492DRAFT_1092096 [Pavlovales sp. CCMP2436]